MDTESGPTAVVDDRTASVRSNEFLVVQVHGKRIWGLPESAGPALREIVLQTAALPAAERTLKVAYRGLAEVQDNGPLWRTCMMELFLLLMRRQRAG